MRNIQCRKCYTWQIDLMYTVWRTELYLVWCEMIYITNNWFITQRVAWSLTLFRLQTDIVDFMNMAKHKWFGADHMTIRPDSKVTVIWLTANHVNVCFIVVCSRIQNHMITPCAILLHVRKIISPWSVSTNEVKKTCSIWL